MHKTEAGAVQLGLHDRPAVESAIDRMRGDLGAERFLVEEMAPGAVAEVLVGVRQVPAVGWVLTLAVGGALVELLGDSVTVVLPASAGDIERALRSLRLFPLLDGYRGRPKADMAGLLRTVEGIVGAAG